MKNNRMSNSWHIPIKSREFQRILENLNSKFQALPFKKK